MNHAEPRGRPMVAWSILATAFVVILVLARHDRASRTVLPLSIDRRTVRLAEAVGPDLKLPPPPAEMRQAAADLERAAKAADEARAGLEQTKQDLERTKETLEKQRQEFEGLREDADANAADSRRQLDDARVELEGKRKELEQASKDAEQRVAKAKQDLEQLQQARLGAAAQAGIAQGLGRGRAFEMKVARDPRRVRNPALAPFVPNNAAVAAAGAAGRRGAAMPQAAGGGGNGPLAATVAGDILRGQADRIRAEGNYAVDASTAAINVETARAMALDNRLRTVETFFEARRINRINRAFEAGPAITLGQAIAMASHQLPPRPSAVELDQATGDIGWPRLLTNPAYADLTAEIQRHFHHRLAVGGSVDYRTAEECGSVFDALAIRLRDDAASHPAGQHGAARNFLDGLRREYDLPLAD